MVCAEEIRLKKACGAIRERVRTTPRIALVLGTGLDAFVRELDVSARIPYEEIPGFPRSTVTGHRGELVFGAYHGVQLAVMSGRVHYYEGYDMADVVTQLRALRLLGAEILFLTNAVGGIAEDLRPGDFMLIEDHISLFVPSPLRGTNCDALGVRFPDMSEVYDAGLRRIIGKAAEEEQVDLKHGVLVQTSGPNFETPAEVRMLGRLGASAVGMSTVCEAIAGRHCGMRVCGISCISNQAAGIADHPLSAEEVFATAAQATPKFLRLLGASIRAMGQN